VCRQNGLRGLILDLAPTSDPVSRDPSVLQVRFAPLAAVLRRASVLVHHGGIGTCALAFQAGVPQIIIPGIGDQWDQAKRVVRLGCGIYLPLRSLNHARLASALMSLMKSEVTRARCVHIAEGFHADGVSRAASLVELAGDRT
jgi:rhamnosyltransferase subunit B